MNWQTITKLVQQIINAIENSAVASVKAILPHTFNVKVTNPTKKVDVKGQVVVSNLKNLDKPLKQLREATLSVKSSVDGIPKEIRVNNFPTEFAISNPPSNKNVVDGINKLSTSVESLHEPLKSLKKVEITNQPTEQLKNIVVEAGKIYRAIGKLKLDPQINVQAPKPDRLVVPPAQVTVEKTEIDYEKLADLLASQIKDFDYKKFASILEEKIGSITVGGGGGGKYAFKKADGTKDQALIGDNGHVIVDISASNIEPTYYYCDTETIGGYRYVGSATASGIWKIERINTATKSMRYASGLLDYADSWTNKVSLEYNYPFE